MLNPSRFVYTSYDKIEEVITSHHVGSKKIFHSGFDEPVQVKQIAVGCLAQGNNIPVHVHADMDECYYILEGDGNIVVNNKTYQLSKGVFINVPAGNKHELQCLSTTLQFFYFGLQIL